MVRLIAAGLLVLAAIPDANAGALSARELDGVPLQVLPEKDLAIAMARLPADAARGPLVIATRVPMTLGLEDGRWLEESDVFGNWAVWRLRLHSPGATLLIPSFDRFDLPDGAELWATSLTDGRSRGPYTRAHRNRSGGLTLPFVPGESVLLELRVPAEARDRVSLSLRSLSHGVLPLSASGLPQPKSGTCNIDVACAEGAPWRDQIRSVVALQVPSLFTDMLCSGQLMNNTARDRRPLILTANHCGASSFNADDIVAIFNFQTSRCNGTPDGSLGDDLTGATFLASDEVSDFALLQLKQTPPAHFNVFYSGFNASKTEVPQNGVSIHHPSGDEKRISIFDQRPARRTQAVKTLPVPIESFEVNWARGVTERGSSGAGLWNERRQLVGVLSGGSANCSTPREADYFGRIDVAWDRGLAPFLDPVQATSREFNGMNPDGSQGTPIPPPPVVSDGGNGGGGAITGLPILFALCLSSVLWNRIRRKSGRRIAA